MHLPKSIFVYWTSNYINHTPIMFEMSKKILEKVSFDRALFYKELVKTLRWLKPDEKMLLKTWCLANFGHLYRDIIADAFKLVTKT